MELLELSLEIPGLLPLVSSSATHWHWPAHTGLDDEPTDDGTGLLDGGGLVTLDGLVSLGGTLDGEGLEGGVLDGGLDDGELDGGLLDGEDDGALELLLEPQLHTSTQEVPAAATLQSRPPWKTIVTIGSQTLLPERYSWPVPTVTEPLKSHTGGGLLLGLLEGGGLLDGELGGLLLGLLDGELDPLLPLDGLSLLALELEHSPPIAITSHWQESAQYLAAPRVRTFAA